MNSLIQGFVVHPSLPIYLSYARVIFYFGSAVKECVTQLNFTISASGCHSAKLHQAP
jgi:hypothetical protein